MIDALHPIRVPSVEEEALRSGETRRPGKITKTGSRHARRLLVEAAWHYARPRPAAPP